MTNRTKQLLLWSALWLALGVGFAMVAVEYPTLPTPPRLFHKAKGVTAGAGAERLITAKLVLPTGRTNVFTWRFNTNHIVYYWELQFSPDLRHWTVVSTSNVTGTVEVMTTKASNGFWRIRGVR